jgi:hypothetical protein
VLQLQVEVSIGTPQRKGEIVRKRFCFVLSAMLTGSLATIANAQTGNPQQKTIPLSLIKDCMAHIEKEDPRTKIVGPFAPAQFNNAISRALAPNVGVVVIAAPARFLTAKTYTGCIYDPENRVSPKDGGLAFRRVLWAADFRARTKLEPGEAP